MSLKGELQVWAGIFSRRYRCEQIGVAVGIGTAVLAVIASNLPAYLIRELVISTRLRPPGSALEQVLIGWILPLAGLASVVIVPILTLFAVRALLPRSGMAERDCTRIFMTAWIAYGALVLFVLAFWVGSVDCGAPIWSDDVLC